MSPSTTPQVNDWFFRIILSFDQPTRRKLLEFWCGTTRVPAVGFAQLHPPMTIAILPKYPVDSLPQTHVCFHRLDLPAYKSEEAFRGKLTQAIQLTGNAISLE